MLQTTQGIVLRSIKYGETSLISTIFTSRAGVQTCILQGVRSSKAKSHRAGLLQPASLLDLVVYQRPNTNLQRIREFQLAYIYTSVHEEVVKNSIALFSVELLLKLLPESAPLPELFVFAFNYFCTLDKMTVADVANLPLYFIIRCSALLGYEIKGNYSAATPHLNLQEGSYTSNAPLIAPLMSNEDAMALDHLLRNKDISTSKDAEMNSAQRYRLLEWYIDFLHQHTQHLGVIRSLEVLQAILH